MAARFYPRICGRAFPELSIVSLLKGNVSNYVLSLCSAFLFIRLTLNSVTSDQSRVPSIVSKVEIELLIRFFRRILAPPQFSSPEETRIAQQMHFFLLFATPIVAAFPLTIYVFGFSSTHTEAWIPAVVSVVLAMLFGVVRRGHLRFASISFIVTAYLSITAAAYFHGGIRDTSMIMIGLPPFLASVFLGRQSTLFCGILSMVIATVFYLAEIAHYLPTHFSDTAGVDTLLVVLMFVVVTTGFLRVTVDQLTASASQIREQAESLQQKNHQLVQIQDSLEKQKDQLSLLNQSLQAEMAERMRTEEALRQKQKLESIGLLAGGIAHDFNNLLTGILGQSSLALYHIENGSSAAPSIKKTISSAEKAAELTSQLLAYAGKGHYQLMDVDLNQLVLDNLDLLGTLIQKHAVFERNLQEELPLVYGDRSQLQQVLMNLVINASEAIPHDNGRIDIATKTAPIANLNGYHLNFAGDDIAEDELYVCLEVSDNGIGMADETIENIFDPFFSTKEVGHGLGLSALMGIIRARNGVIQVTSQLGSGSCFRVFFKASNPKQSKEIQSTDPSLAEQEH